MFIILCLHETSTTTAALETTNDPPQEAGAVSKDDSKKDPGTERETVGLLATKLSSEASKRRSLSIGKNSRHSGSSVKSGGEKYVVDLRRCSKTKLEEMHNKRESRRSDIFASLDREEFEANVNEGPLMRRAAPMRSKSTQEDKKVRPLILRQGPTRSSSFFGNPLPGSNHSHGKKQMNVSSLQANLLRAASNHSAALSNQSTDDDSEGSFAENSITSFGGFGGFGDITPEGGMEEKFHVSKMLTSRSDFGNFNASKASLDLLSLDEGEGEGEGEGEKEEANAKPAAVARTNSIRAGVKNQPGRITLTATNSFKAAQKIRAPAKKIAAL